MHRALLLAILCALLALAMPGCDPASSPSPFCSGGAVSFALASPDSGEGDDDEEADPDAEEEEDVDEEDDPDDDSEQDLTTPATTDITPSLTLLNDDALNDAVRAALTTLVQPNTTHVMEISDALPAMYPALVAATELRAKSTVVVPASPTQLDLVELSRALFESNGVSVPDVGAVSSTPISEIDPEQDLASVVPDVLVLTSTLDSSLLGGGLLDAATSAFARGVALVNRTTVVPCRARVFAQPADSKLGIPTKHRGLNFSVVAERRPHGNVVQDSARFPYQALGKPALVAQFDLKQAATSTLTKFGSYDGVVDRAGQLNAFVLTWELDVACNGGEPFVGHRHGRFPEYVLMLDPGQDEMVEAGARVHAVFARTGRTWHVSKHAKEDALVVVRSECGVPFVVSFGEEDLGEVQWGEERAVRPPVGETLVAREAGFERGEGVIAEWRVPEAGTGEFVVRCEVEENEEL